MDYKVIPGCRLCDGPCLETVFEFGEMPLANAYPCKPDAHELLFPLTVMKCNNCGHVQLRETVAPEILFAEYLYSASTSPALVAEMKELAGSVALVAHLAKDSGILEIGCNDGILLREFAALGFVNLHGVDPASNLAAQAKGTGANIITDFFTRDLAREIRREFGPMQVICCTNAFAHIEDIAGVVEGVCELLGPEGVFIFENAYLLDMVQNRYFDAIYHEHLQYFGVAPLRAFLARLGLSIGFIDHVKAQGGSIRVFAHRGGESYMVEQLADAERKMRLYDDDTYRNFASRLMKDAETFKTQLRTLKAEGKSVSCYGCPAKFALFSKVFGLTRDNVDYVVDDSPLKQGRFTPRAKIPIVSNAHFRTNPTDCCIITAWNTPGVIKHRNPEYRGEWIVPM
jgi:SAM-dependent methyltransferase